MKPFLRFLLQQAKNSRFRKRRKRTPRRLPQSRRLACASRQVNLRRQVWQILRRYIVLNIAGRSRLRKMPKAANREYASFPTARNAMSGNSSEANVSRRSLSEMAKWLIVYLTKNNLTGDRKSTR